MEQPTSISEFGLPTFNGLNIDHIQCINDIMISPEFTIQKERISSSRLFWEAAFRKHFGLSYSFEFYFKPSKGSTVYEAIQEILLKNQKEHPDFTIKTLWNYAIKKYAKDTLKISI